MGPVILSNHSFSKMYSFSNDQPRTIYDVIATANYPTAKVGNYINSPIVSKKHIWEPLGDFVSSNERQVAVNVTSDYYTLRADGKSFSKRIKMLRTCGVFPKGYVLNFERIMQRTVEDIFTDKKHAVCAFVQSDEMTFIFRSPPRGENQKNQMNYLRCVKEISHMAGEVSARFNLHLVKEMQEADRLDLLLYLPVLYFDCRLAQWDSFRAAFQLVLWRAYDCMVNGITSGVFFGPPRPNKKRDMALNSTGKLALLEERGELTDMTPHQLYGSFFFKERQKEERFSEHLSEPVVKTVTKVRCVSYPLLTLLKDGHFHFPGDDAVDFTVSGLSENN